jgi:hypothetical protein
MLFVCSAKPTDLKNAICYNAIYQMEDDMTKFKVGDKVIYKSEGPDNGSRGTVTHTLGKRFEVEWSDGETYCYEDWPGGCVCKDK